MPFEISLSGKVLKENPDWQKPRRATCSMFQMVPIIIVDDSRADADLALRMLQQCKVLNPISCFSSGAECVSYFEQVGSHTAGTLPSLVLLDVSMQPLSGLDVL